MAVINLNQKMQQHRKLSHLVKSIKSKPNMDGILSDAMAMKDHLEFNMINWIPITFLCEVEYLILHLNDEGDATDHDA